MPHGTYRPEGACGKCVQIDVNVNGQMYGTAKYTGNCSSPTNTPVVAQCQNIKIYKGGEDISAAIRTNTAVIRRGDVLQIAVVGATASKARIGVSWGPQRLSDAPWTETTEKNNKGEFVMNFTVPSSGDRNVKVEAEIQVANVWR